MLESGPDARAARVGGEGVDCVIRAGEVSEQSMVARRIGVFQFITCATPAFLKIHGMPTTLEELGERPTVGMMSARSSRALAFRFSGGKSETELALDHKL